MSANTSEYTEEETEAIDDYMRSVLRLVVAWLHKAASILKTALPDMRRDADIFFVDEDVALLRACPEIMGMVKRLLCGCHRCLRYYFYYDKNVQSCKEPVSEPSLANVNFVGRRARLDQDYEVDQFKERVLECDDDLVFG